MRSIRPFALALLGLLALIPPCTAHASDGDVLERFTGVYDFAGGEAQRAEVHRAIDRVVSQLPFFIRGIARDRIRERVRPDEQVSLTMTSDGRVSVRFDDWMSPPTAVGAPARAIRGPDGAVTRFSIRRRGALLETVASTDQGTRTCTFSGTDDGRFLYLHVSVASSQLPESIRYTLSYRAQPARLASR